MGNDIIVIPHWRNMAVLEIINSAGKYHDDYALMDVINYCCNPEKTRSGLVGGVAVNPLYFEE